MQNIEQPSHSKPERETKTISQREGIINLSDDMHQLPGREFHALRERLREVRDFDELEALYESWGEDVSSLERLFDVIEGDWALCRAYEAAVNSYRAFPDTFPSLEVTDLKGRRFDLIGYAHVDRLGDELEEALRRKLLEPGITLFEENLSGFSYTADIDGFEIDDHNAEGVLMMTLDFLQRLPSELWSSICEFMERFGVGRYAEAHKRLQNHPLLESYSDSDSSSESSLPKPELNLYEHLALQSGADIDDPYPKNLDIILAEQAGDRDSCQRRSLYMARFLQHWSDCSGNPGPIRCLHGFEHSQEIKFYLLKEPGNSAVERRARRSAELLAKSPRRHLLQRHLRSTLVQGASFWGIFMIAKRLGIL